MEKILYCEIMNHFENELKWIVPNPLPLSYAISFTNDYNNILNDDLKEIAEATDQEKEDYSEMFKSLLINLIKAKSKKSRFEILQHFREKTKKSILKNLQNGKKAK